MNNNNNQSNNQNGNNSSNQSNDIIILNDDPSTDNNSGLQASTNNSSSNHNNVNHSHNANANNLSANSINNANSTSSNNNNQQQQQQGNGSVISGSIDDNNPHSRLIANNQHQNPKLDFSKLPNINLSQLTMTKDNQTNNNPHKTTSSPLKRSFSSMDSDKHFDQNESLTKKRRLNHDIHNSTNNKLID